MRRLIAALVGLAALFGVLALTNPAGAQAAIPYVGLTPGSGTGEIHSTPDLTGWQTALNDTGTFPGTVKLFDPAAGYPNLPTAWKGDMATFAANDGGHALLPLIAYNNVPTTANFESLLTSLPQGQKLAFVYQSEAENTGSGINGPTFVANWGKISANLNAALAYMAAHPVGGNPTSFYVRSNFMMINSAYMAYYQAHPGSTAFIPPASEVDAYGADFYQHIGGSQSVGLAKDPRYQGYLKALRAKNGTARLTLAFPEYGISIPSYSAANESARAALLGKDIAYLTGSAAPGTTVVLNYWYQMDASPKFYTFPLMGKETTAQASPTITAWHSIAG